MLNSLVLTASDRASVLTMVPGKLLQSFVHDPIIDGVPSIPVVLLEKLIENLVRKL